MIDELHHDEGRDRQDHRDEARDEQAGQFDEHAERQPVVHHQLDEAQRLHQPDQRGEPARHGDQRERELTEDVTVEPRDQLAGAHCA